MKKLISVIMALFLLSISVLAADSVVVDVEKWEENNSYPEWYGGRYQDESGKMVYVIVEGYEDILAGDFFKKNTYVIKKYSLNQLRKVQEEIGEQWMSNNADGEICVIATGINEISNQVDVTLYTGSSKIEEAREQLYQKYGDMISIDVSNTLIRALPGKPPKSFGWLPVAAIGIAAVVSAGTIFLWRRRILKNRGEGLA